MGTAAGFAAAPRFPGSSRPQGALAANPAAAPFDLMGSALPADPINIK